MLVRVLEYPPEVKKYDSYLRNPVTSNSVFHYGYVNYAGFWKKLDCNISNYAIAAGSKQESYALRLDYRQAAEKDKLVVK